MRTSLSPTFMSTGKLKRMTPLILECVDTMNDTIDNIIASSNGILSAPVDVKRVTGAYAMESTIQMTFSRKVSALDDPNNPIIENVRKIHKNSLLSLVKLSTIMLAPYVARMLRISQFDSKVTQFFSDFTLNLIDERKRVSETESAVKKVDFLQLMLDSMRDNNNQAIDGSDDYTDSKGGEKYGEIRATAGMRDKVEILQFSCSTKTAIPLYKQMMSGCKPSRLIPAFPTGQAKTRLKSRSCRHSCPPH
ncbi:unnamed protein product [Oppiella nova]|uniref:Cytochrome P450 n=1 Tax=Oppiella nova TaxID=334625 RepID=A0A7R9QS85_9ACAR|nr:unnamed protein product [Oppiella nova]CAG2173498.1 unnamed protein product [Oppiella nova]